ncbi:hypothetical protein [Acinetobacter sp. P1(2025)]|uniref:hypothetical protein n=1 Tax=Acinetobacter sp. P1(2025) TaxID=3446120 RepID=UPI003F53B243
MTKKESERQAVQALGELIALHKFSFRGEKELQDGVEQLLKEHGLKYEREVRLSRSDIVDFVVNFDQGKIALELKVDGNRNALLRQMSRYLTHEDIDCIFVVGTPYWVMNLPQTLHEKDVYCYRILAGIF